MAMIDEFFRIDMFG